MKEIIIVKIKNDYKIKRWSTGLAVRRLVRSGDIVSSGLP